MAPLNGRSNSDKATSYFKKPDVPKARFRLDLNASVNGAVDVERKVVSAGVGCRIEH